MDDVNHVTPPTTGVAEAAWTGSRGAWKAEIWMDRMFIDRKPVVSNRELVL